MDVVRLLLVLTIKKFPIDIAKIKLFFNFGTKSSLSTSVFIFSTIFQIKKILLHILFKKCRSWTKLFT